MTIIDIYRLGSSVILGIALFFPVRSFILALMINRHQRKVQRDVTDEERAAFKKRIVPAAAVISLTFAFIFQKVFLANLLGAGR